GAKARFLIVFRLCCGKPIGRSAAQAGSQDFRLQAARRARASWAWLLRTAIRGPIHVRRADVLIRPRRQPALKAHGASPTANRPKIKPQMSILFFWRALLRGRG